MNARNIRTSAHPFVTLRHVPQCVDHLPGSTPIARAEQPARHGAAPDHPRLIRPACLERPDQLRRPVYRLAPAIKINEPYGLFRIGGRGDFLPGLSALVAAMQLDAEMAVVERRIVRAVTRIMQGERHIVA